MIKLLFSNLGEVSCKKALTLCAVISILLLNGCLSRSARIAMKTSNFTEGKTAIENVSNQTQLAKIAMGASEIGIRAAAVMKLTDQLLIGKIAKENTDESIRVNAVEKIEDQSLLIKFVTEDTSLFIRMAAINKLSDQTLLAKLAVEDTNNNIRREATNMLIDPYLLARIVVKDEACDVRSAAISKLTDPMLMTKIANEKEDTIVQLIYKFLSAFDNIPMDYRLRLQADVSGSLVVLSDPDVANKVGEVVSISTKWSPIHESYSEGKTMDGEGFTCSIKLKKLKRPLSYSWCTQFPPVTSSFSFLPAEVNEYNLFGPILSLLSQDILANTALYASDIDVGRAAIEKITDLSLLEMIVLESKENFKLPWIYETAQERLNILCKK